MLKKTVSFIYFDSLFDYKLPTFPVVYVCLWLDTVNPKSKRENQQQKENSDCKKALCSKKVVLYSPHISQRQYYAFKNFSLFPKKNVIVLTHTHTLMLRGVVLQQRPSCNY